MSSGFSHVKGKGFRLTEMTCRPILVRVLFHVIETADARAVEHCAGLGGLRIGNMDNSMLGVILITLLFGSASMAHAQSLDTIRQGLPDSVMSWTTAEEDRLYEDRTIFDYIDGAAEVYRAYNMQRCLSRRYVTPQGPAIILDIFDMGSSQDAYGVFTHDQDGEKLNLGQGAYFRAGWLSLWKDRFFISIYAERETEASRAAVLALGETVSSLVTREGPKPRILSSLPQEGLQRESIKYFHNHVVLNRHYYLTTENMLNLGKATDGALASYSRETGSARLLYIEYPDPGSAKAAHEAFLRHYLPDGGPSGMALLENKQWCGVRLKGKGLAIVLEADNRELAQSLLQEVVE
jgi:hypothetical protein